ncbi:MAG: hypothetical protein ABI720_01100 [Actinomycetes bacterium]
MQRLALTVMASLLALVGCTSSDPSAGSGSPTEAEPRSSVTSAPTTTTVTLDVGHCWVGYLRSDGETWALTPKQQFGWGGGIPRHWRGDGQVTRVSTSTLIYVDRGGHQLMFVPVDSPKAYTTEGLGCD